MTNSELAQPGVSQSVAEYAAAQGPPVEALAGITVAALALESCGSSSSGGSTSVVPPVVTPAFRTTALSASRFLAQTSMGATADSIARVRTLGFDDWITEQFNLPRSQTLWDWLVANGYNVAGNVNNEAGFDPAMWSQLITGPDQLRQRVGLALLDFLVVGISGAALGGFRQFAMAAYIDVLMDNAFGNYRVLLDQISTNAAMGSFLTYIGNRKANTATGALPDENYARELMQLFTIGLTELNADGSQKLNAGAPIETYSPDDVSGMARVWTGWNLDSSDNTTPDRYRRPMINTASQHETGAKTFLGKTISANTNGVDSKNQALDTLFAHANIAPFVSRRLIQRLVTSNPSAAYVGRVAAAFVNNGSGVRGDMKAIIRAILTDSEARNDAASASSSFGKVRDPVLRLTGWARAFGANSPGNGWAFGDTSAVTRLAQSPGRSPSVFGFFRPGYTPPNSAIANANLVAPELQLANETSVIGYVNYMQTVISTGIGDVRANYTDLIAKAPVSATLIEEINLTLAAGQLSAATSAQIKAVVDGISADTPAGLNNRVYMALLLTLASPEYLVQK
jgi:uncharacterized protein (DUF1800 family)